MIDFIEWFQEKDFGKKLVLSCDIQLPYLFKIFHSYAFELFCLSYIFFVDPARFAYEIINKNLPVSSLTRAFIWWKNCKYHGFHFVKKIIK
jgi:hypothetical protein